MSKQETQSILLQQRQHFGERLDIAAGHVHHVAADEVGYGDGHDEDCQQRRHIVNGQRRVDVDLRLVPFV